MKTPRHFVCGDIHGCYDELMAKLDEVGFDKTYDKLHALGDLVDEGPKSKEVVMLLKEPWFDSILGNHEELMIQHFRAEAEGVNNEAGYWHIVNGGSWFLNHTLEEQAEMIELVTALPIYRTITTMTGARVGLVHADILYDDWELFTQRAKTEAVRSYALWARERVYDTEPLPIKGIDYVYFGHTPLKEVRRRANMSWIDTGCYHTGILTMEELA